MDGILAKCGTIADHIEEAMGRGGPGDAAPSDEEEIEPREAEPEEQLEEDPSEGLGSTSLVHLN